VAGDIKSSLIVHLFFICTCLLICIISNLTYQYIGKQEGGGLNSNGDNSGSDNDYDTLQDNGYFVGGLNHDDYFQGICICTYIHIYLFIYIYIS
jgi:hypothetical protein